MDEKAKRDIADLMREADQYRYKNLQQSETLSQKLLEASRKHEHFAGQVQALLDLAHLAYLRSHLDDCYTFANEAQLLAHEHDMPVQVGFALYEKFRFFRLSALTDEALDALYQMKQIAEEHQNTDLLACALQGLGAYECWANPAKHDVGVGYIVKAIEYLSQEDSKLPLADAWHSLALAYSEEDNHKALEHAETGYKIAVEQGHIHSQHYLVDTLSMIYTNLGDFETAHELAQNAIKFAKAHDLPTEYNLSKIAYIYIQEKKYKDAIEILKDLVGACVTSKNFHLLSFVYLDLTDACERLGDYEQALKYNKLSHANSQGMQDKQMQFRIQELQTKYEVEATKREAELHKMKTQLLEQQLQQQKIEEEQRITALAQEFQQELAAQKQKILDRLSHEFRTPLAVIQTSVGILDRYRDKLSDEQRAKYIARLYEQVKVIDMLLDDILDILRQPEIHQHVELSRSQLEVLYEMVIADACRKVRGTSVDRIQVDFDMSVESIHTNQQMLRQILIHVLTNALKYSDDKVKLELQVTADNVRIIVTDRGIGIPQDEQAQVFDMLVRGSNINEVSGNGLGLTIVRNYVELLGGQLRLSSRVDEGTHIHILLPLK